MFSNAAQSDKKAFKYKILTRGYLLPKQNSLGFYHLFFKSESQQCSKETARLLLLIEMTSIIWYPW